MTRTITIGPYHPYLLEPSIVDLQVVDGRVSDATITVGFVNRAVEELMTKKTYRQAVVLAEQVCGICSNVHSLAFCQATEEILGVEIPRPGPVHPDDRRGAGAAPQPFPLPGAPGPRPP